MAHKLFEDFLANAERYDACRQYWEQLVHEIEESLGQGSEWERWIPRYDPGGNPVEMDGNPIADGRSRSLDRAFRIMQHRQIGRGVEITAWLKIYDDEIYKSRDNYGPVDFPGAELFINLSLSEESAQIARYILTKWMSTDNTVEAMQQFLREIEKCNK